MRERYNHACLSITIRLILLWYPKSPLRCSNSLTYSATRTIANTDFTLNNTYLPNKVALIAALSRTAIN
jgi:hypothetical protein